MTRRSQQYPPELRERAVRLVIEVTPNGAAESTPGPTKRREGHSPPPPGFYMRVIAEGEARAGDKIIRVAAGPERVSVAAADALLNLPDPDTHLSVADHERR